MSQPKLPILQACNKPNPTEATVKIKPYKAMDSFRRWSLTSTAAWIKFVVLESAAERILRVGDEADLFDLLVNDPLALVPATDGVDGEAFAPVEPVRWEVRPAALAAVAGRCRPRLPSSVDGSGEPLAPLGSELATSLRCYTYLPGTASLPHYDKSTVNADTGAFSAYTVVMYLNGDDHGGGVTSFYERLRSDAVEAEDSMDANRSKSKGGAT